MKFIKSGLFGEYLTIVIYKLKFYNILAHRKKTILGEIDFIAQKPEKNMYVHVCYVLNEAKTIEQEFGNLLLINAILR